MYKVCNGFLILLDEKIFKLKKFLYNYFKYFILLCIKFEFIYFDYRNGEKLFFVFFY